MTIKARKYLSDIFYSIGMIEDFVSGISTFRAYSKDHKTKAAVERYLSIIGEAVSKFSIENQGGTQLVNTPQIISFRNRLVHEYDAIDDAIVWAAVKKELPKLKIEVNSILAS